MKEIKTFEELETVLNNNEKVLVKIGTSVCGPCKITENNLEEIKSDFPDILFVKVDADECSEELLDSFNIMSIPVLILYKNKVIVEKAIGLKTKEGIKELITNKLEL